MLNVFSSNIYFGTPSNNLNRAIYFFFPVNSVVNYKPVITQLGEMEYTSIVVCH